jgi:hypothetical protein
MWTKTFIEFINYNVPCGVIDSMHLSYDVDHEFDLWWIKKLVFYASLLSTCIVLIQLKKISLVFHNNQSHTHSFFSFCDKPIEQGQASWCLLKVLLQSTVIQKWQLVEKGLIICYCFDFLTSNENSFSML